ncbi:MgtC/SapB transporter [Actinobacillus pleuropneumoniae]|nr:MgtC/SapB transporter [Actinobacillus pleuropneumoniae]
MTNPWVIDNVSILLRLLLAMLLGGLIGLNGSVPTMPQDCVPTSWCAWALRLLCCYPFTGFPISLPRSNVRIDPARLATAVITGIGFLGAGTILFTGKSITGLTTAASIWVVGAVGLAVGAGFYFASIVSTVLILLNLVVFNKLEQRYIRGSKLHLITLHAANTPNILDDISAVLEEQEFVIKKLVVNERSNAAYGELQPAVLGLEISLQVLTDRKFEPMEITRQLRGIGHVTMVTAE